MLKNKLLNEKLEMIKSASDLIWDIDNFLMTNNIPAYKLGEYINSYATKNKLDDEIIQYAIDLWNNSNRTQIDAIICIIECLLDETWISLLTLKEQPKIINHNQKNKNHLLRIYNYVENNKNSNLKSSISIRLIIDDETLDILLNVLDRVYKDSKNDKTIKIGHDSYLTSLSSAKKYYYYLNSCKTYSKILDEFREIKNGF